LDALSLPRETLFMTTLVPDPIHLHRIDLDRNMRRFYELSVQPTLFGGASLVRTWGRIGSGGQSLIETFRPPDRHDSGLRPSRTDEAPTRLSRRAPGGTSLKSAHESAIGECTTDM